MKPPILITGCARSGTSMTAGIICQSGAKGGDMFGRTRFNPRGMFENRILREGLVKPYLRSIGADPMGQNPLPDMKKVWDSANDEEFVSSWRKNVEGVMRAQDVGDGDVWCYKGAKMCLFWPVWHRAFPDATWVITRRTTIDIVNSCLRTSFMRAHHSSSGWIRWVDVHLRRFSEMEGAGLRVLYVWPEKVIGGDVSVYYSMLDRLGLQAPDNIVERFVNPVLWGKKK